MQITWDDLIIDQNDVDIDELLEEWRWLVRGHHTLVVISALGDLFLQASDKSVFWLDTRGASFTKIAKSVDEFKILARQANYLEDWFSPRLIADLRTRGIRLGHKQCYSFKVPLTLGGKMDPNNFEPTDLSVHFGLLGQLQRQGKDLPEGTRIKSVRISKHGA